MTLDPNARASWLGFLDLLRPPDGHVLRAAIGTSFGVSFDALFAALLAMSDADADALRHDPVAGVLAATRLSERVRVLIHPGTIKAPNIGTSTPIVGLLDRIFVSVRPPTGLFHPKLWLLRFSPNSSSDDGSRDVARVIVASRNLTMSRAFEAGIALEGRLTEDGSALGDDVGKALRAWTRGLNLCSTAVADLLNLAPKAAFDAPYEGRKGMRLRWQGNGRSQLIDHLPETYKRGVIVSPFMRPDFVQAMSARGGELMVVSTPEGLNSLDERTLAALDTDSTDDPRMFVVGEHGDPDDAFVEGIHAKLVLLDTPDGSVTYVGSANATGPGWGLNGTNVEAMLELKPGLKVDDFVKAFLIDQHKVRPWVRPFRQTDREPVSDEQEIEHRLEQELRRFGAVHFVLSYEASRSSLTIERLESLPLLREDLAGLEIELAPYCKAGSDDAFRSISEIRADAVQFNDVSLSDVSAFVVLRARSGTIVKRAITLGLLRMTDGELSERDEAVRAQVLSTARPEDVLRALIFGIGRLSRPGREGHTPGQGKAISVHQQLEAVTLESLLKAVAHDRTLIRELRLVMGACAGEPFARFCDELAAASRSAEGARL